VVTDPSLLQLMRGGFSSAKLFRTIAVMLYIGAILLGVVTTISGHALLVILAPFIMSILHGLSFVTENVSRVERSRAEAVRRALLLEDGLAWPVSPREEANLRAEASYFALELARRADISPYYASSRPEGPERLLEHVSESIYFTRHIARSASHWLLSASILVALGGISALVFAILAVSQRDVQIAIAKAAISILLIAAASPPLQDAVAFGRLSNKSANLDEQAEKMKYAQISIESVLKLVYTYDCARLGAPLLPGLIYRHKRARLNTLWQRRIGRDKER